MHEQMIKQVRRRRLTLVIGAALATGALGLAGCAAMNKTASAPATNVAAPPAQVAAAPVDSGETGAQLWAENCARCHNLRSPSEFSPAEWSIIVQEMRVRAPLSGEQQKKITQFLQSASG